MVESDISVQYKEGHECRFYGNQKQCPIAAIVNAVTILQQNRPEKLSFDSLTKLSSIDNVVVTSSGNMGNRAFVRAACTKDQTPKCGSVSVALEGL